MPDAVAINVGANTSLPGFRGPVWPDGRFEYVPIPEREPTTGTVPTYADLDLDVELPESILDRRVHLDPSFRGYADCEEYTYGDEHGVKAGPISELSAGDYLLFYATLEPALTGEDPPSLGGPTPGEDARPHWQAPEWGAYLIGLFRLGVDPLSKTEYEGLAPEADLRRRLSGNAHCKRERFDARVLAYGDPERSTLLERAVPLSARTGGSDPNRLVTEFSADSGAGPWWRRPLGFDAEATERLLGIVREADYEACFA